MRHPTRGCTGATLVMALTLTTACVSTTAPRVGPDEQPVVDQIGATMGRYTDDLLEVLLDYGYASRSLGDEWLIVDQKERLVPA